MADYQFMISLEVRMGEREVVRKEELDGVHVSQSSKEGTKHFAMNLTTIQR
jgi:hypothetical protein